MHHPTTPNCLSASWDLTRIPPAATEAQVQMLWSWLVRVGEMSEWAQHHTLRAAWSGEGGIASFGREPVVWGEPQGKSSDQGQQSRKQSISLRQTSPLPSAQSSICIKKLSLLLFCLIGREHLPMPTGTTAKQPIKAGVSSR